MINVFVIILLVRNCHKRQISNIIAFCDYFIISEGILIAKDLKGKSKYAKLKNDGFSVSDSEKEVHAR